MGTVLVFHAGGFVYGDASSAAGYCQEFADAGYDSVSVDYPTYDYPGALRYSRHAALAARKQGLPTYAVGWSAGGTFAAMLAALRDVNAGVAISAPTDLLRWNGTNKHYYRDMIKLRTLEARRRGSPYYRYRPGLSCPLLLMHGRPPDRIVHYWQSVRFARKDHLKLITLKHGHLKDPSSGPRAVRWIDKQPGTGCAVRSP